MYVDRLTAQFCTYAVLPPLPALLGGTVLTPLRPVYPTERFFRANWREEYAVLYEDSSLLWYKSRERPQPEGALLLRRAPELMAVGVFTRAVPRPPEFPGGTDIRRVLALGSSASHRVQWFICHSEDDAK